jgi:glucose-6-phosphate 1-dehydrogenase
MEEFDIGTVPSKYLRTCDIPRTQLSIKPFTMVIFGGAGDLTKRKLLPALFYLFKEKELPKDFSIIGFARAGLDDKGYREMMMGAVAEFGQGSLDKELWGEFSRHVYFLSGHFEDDEAYTGLFEKILQVCPSPEKEKVNLIHYMAAPPQAIPAIIGKLKGHDLCKDRVDAKIIVEKPFGSDLQSAVMLNKVLTDAFEEKQIYRIDHYLGKETVQNILFLRFSNSIFERLWDSRYIDHVQITVAEEIGIEHRGPFYEQTGIVRDMVQNHVMQLVALVAMEPPIGFEAEFIRDERLKVFQALMPLKDEEVDKYAVRGQYGPGKVRSKDAAGYREENRVAPDSVTPTFFAARMFIANWRWAGVPFYVRTGKRLSRRITEVCIQFKQPPLKLFGRTCDILEPNVLVLTIQPEETISLRFGVKYPDAPNQIYPANMLFGYQDTFNIKAHPAYERLLIDCMRGDLTLFVRQDAIESTWEVVDPIIERWEDLKPVDFPNYSAGSRGPTDAELLLQQDGRCWLTK